MKAPAFWSAPPGTAAWLLAPLGAGWAAGARLRIALGKPWRAPVPVICVGNLVAGGTGKTPVALSLAARLPGFHALSRGYGGREAGPARIDAETGDAARFGDEPLLLAQALPCWVARDRVAGAKAACAAGAAGLILDDGFQDPALAKDLSLLVVDGATGFGNGSCIPAGPLREPVAPGLARADAVVVMGEDRAGIARLAADRPLLRARLEPDPGIGATLRGKRVLAFAGIGRPRKFFETLAGLGTEIARRREFPDHHPYSEAELSRLRAEAARDGLLLVTTGKDMIRIPPQRRDSIVALPVTVAWEDESQLESLLAPLRRALP